MLDPLDLELQKPEPPDMGARNLSPVLCMSDMQSLLMSPFSSLLLNFIKLINFYFDT